MGTGCEGAMRVLLDPAAPGSIAAVALATAASNAHQGVPTSLVMVHEAADLNLGTFAAAAPLPLALVEAARPALARAASTAVNLEVDGRRTRAFVQFLAPPPHLLVCRAGPDECR
jgi:hypothetical protein